MPFRPRRTLVGVTVLLLEVGLLAGCGYFAWRFVSAPARAEAVVVQQPPSHPASSPVTPTLPLAPTAAGSPAGAGAPSLPGLGVGLVDRLNRDDQRLYQEQWKVINLLLGGIRRYVEQRLKPLVMHSLH